ncbi:unnamed protein product, partial [Scytosiphon promiscuus]
LRAARLGSSLKSTTPTCHVSDVERCQPSTCIRFVMKRGASDSNGWETSSWRRPSFDSLLAEPWPLSTGRSTSSNSSRKSGGCRRRRDGAGEE